MTATSTPNWIFWSGTIGLDSPLESRIDAAHATDCSRVSISTADIERAKAEGRSARDVGEQFSDAGLQLVMDPITNWYPGTPHAQSRFGRFTAEETLRACAEAGVVSITAIAFFNHDNSADELVEPFGSLCDRAADFGAQVHLEFIPVSAVRDISDAWRIVRAADRPNGGILFDTYHFFRGNPDYRALHEVPGERIYAVQVDDALEAMHGSFRDDTLNRLLPGDGDFDLVRVISALDAIGGLSWVGPEVINPVLAAMDPVEAATLAMDRTRSLLASSGLKT